VSPAEEKKLMEKLVTHPHVRDWRGKRREEGARPPYLHLDKKQDSEETKKKKRNGKVVKEKEKEGKGHSLGWM